MKITCPIFVLTLICFPGCGTHQKNSKYVSQMHASLFPFDSREYTRLDDIKGEWIQCPEDIFFSKAPWGYDARITVMDRYIEFRVRPWSDDWKSMETELFLLFVGFDNLSKASRMIQKDPDGFILLKMPRRDIYMQGAKKLNKDYLGVGTFDPPVVFERKKEPNQRLQTMRFRLPMNAIAQGPHV